jgi:hypothetical protein
MTDFQYTKTAAGIEITAYTGNAKELLIPAALDGLPVVSIGQCAFYSNELTSVIIPDSVTSIVARAFDRGVTIIRGGQ